MKPRGGAVQPLWRVLARLVFAIAFLLATWPAAGSAQHASADLYQAKVIVTGTDMRSRLAGFVRALLEVLVKVTSHPRIVSDPG
jgi:hypothetical protein